MPNRLAREASPYLLQHATNPVDWFPWGPEAFGIARELDRPILLSIGYSACHWCHVMERESFENDAIAAIMNLNFVNIKVDREERPDLDQIYQLVVQLMGRSGGWPLTVFLTPDQKPFFGGTYFPPTDRYGMPGFPKVLNAIADAYRQKHGDVVAQADELAGAIAKVGTLETHGAKYRPGPDVLDRAAVALETRFDRVHGGFGSRPKFPHTMALALLLRRGVLEKDARALAHTRLSLDRLRAGGVYDQLGGGFHRYSTDEHWLVPHFEKMLYDNALLLRLYTDAWRATGEATYAETAREIARYVAREMTDPQGGFYATQDADSEGVEGKFFVWTPDEVARALEGDEEARRAVVERFGVTSEGNFEESGATVLHEAKPLADVARALGLGAEAAEVAIRRARERLFAVREGRVRPFRDEKVLASWNALMIGALADAGAALGDPGLVAAAERAYAFVRAKLVVANESETRVLRHVKGDVAKGPGFLDDHAFLADAALDLYQVTGEPRYVADAQAFADAMLARFWDPVHGGFYFVADDGEKLIYRPKDPFDHAVPSGESIASQAMLRLGGLVDAKYADYASRQLELLAGPAVESPFDLAQTVAVIDTLVRGTLDVVVVGPRESEATRALARAAFAVYAPNRAVAWLDPGDAASRAACALLAEGKPAKPVPVAYVCRGRTCSAPVETPEELERLLRTGMG